MIEPISSGKNYIQEVTPYTVFLQHTNQKDVAANTLYRYAIEHITSYANEEIEWQYADIGCGSGEISSILLQKLLESFRKITVKGTFLEPSKVLLNRTKENLPQNKRFLKHFINADIETLDSNGIAHWGRNNFVVCCHVLYYLREWQDQIRKILNSLTPNGKTFFVIHTYMSHGIKIRKLFLNSIDRQKHMGILADDVERQLKDFGISYSKNIITSKIVFPLSHALEMPLSPDAIDISGKNVAFDIARFYTPSEFWHLASSDILGEIREIYLRNQNNDEIVLNTHEAYICCQATI